MSISAKLLRRLEEAEKRIVPSEIDVMVFIEETAEKGVYHVQENVYHGTKNHTRDYIKQWDVKASSAREVAENYEPPEGCKEPLIFMYDYGE